MERTGTRTVAGKPCIVYRSSSGGQPRREICVFDGWVLEEISQRGSSAYWKTVTSIQFPAKIPERMFQLPPGTVVKTPARLKVKLPSNVKLVEYPGYGIRFPGESPNEREGREAAFGVRRLLPCRAGRQRSSRPARLAGNPFPRSNRGSLLRYARRVRRSRRFSGV